MNREEAHCEKRNAAVVAMAVRGGPLYFVGGSPMDLMKAAADFAKRYQLYPLG